MGAWGIKTFENDGAMDWLGEFLEAPGEQTILRAFSPEPAVARPGLLGRLMGKKPGIVPAELDGEEVLAAAEVVATILGKPGAYNPEELASPPNVALRPETPQKALSAIDRVMANSNLKDCWQETEDFEAWKAEVADLRSRLANL